MTYASNISDIPEDTIIAILATSSKPRRKIVEQLVERVHGLKYMILEKVAFQSIRDLYEVGVLLREKGIKAYVNTARRNFRFYQDLREKLKEEPYINMNVEGGEWGMGCNSVHQLDIYAYISGATIFKADNNSLELNVYPSKRQGYMEFYGQERIETDRGRLTMTAQHDSSARFFVTISSENYHYFIDQESKVAEYRCSQDGWIRHEITLDFLPISHITQLNIIDLLDNGTCNLTEYDESVVIHECLLGSFLEHYNRITGGREKECPIT